ncbi:hypothetical protein [Actinophytocola sp.]|uniref:hypothetical protein n=1 Tax=Actinophytocola sp. TaxID=1872138 RepID=UPI002D39ABEC|nr:hypothetical protein [Actinophytocola sp.]HYQ61944.1 hypothetical protein [Actinophytocola sp.]
MSDLRNLHDAFAELERRADATAVATAPVTRPRRAVRLIPVATTVVAVAGLVAGAVWLVPRDSGTDAAGPPATSSTAPSTARIPTTPDELIARFRAVLGDTATFEVTMKDTLPGGPQPSTVDMPPGSGLVDTPSTNPAYPTTAVIGGTLTSAGFTGSFFLAIHPSDPEPSEWCHLSFVADCDISTLPDGSQLATGTGHRAPGAASYLACLKRPDGTTVLIQVSNQEDPSGAVLDSPGGEILAPQPPLTLDQLKAIVTSDKW